MPDSLDLTVAISDALTSFRWGSCGYDDMDIDIRDPALDIKTALTDHLVIAVEKLLED